MPEKTPKARRNLLSASATMVALAFIGVGATTDTTAFKGVMDLVVSTESDAASWVMAIGATSLALLTAWNIGVLLRKRVRHEPGATWQRIAWPLLFWLVLGAALFLVRWFGAEASDSGGADVHAGLNFALGSGQLDITTTPPALSSVHLAALFFAAIYLVSGLCAMYEAERLYRPGYLRYLRCKQALRYQEEATARTIAEATEAEEEVLRCEHAFDLNEAHRDAAIGDRRAFGTELAHYARVVMAIVMNDPAKTNVTDTGPRPYPGWADPDDPRAATA